MGLAGEEGGCIGTGPTWGMPGPRLWSLQFSFRLITRTNLCPLSFLTVWGTRPGLVVMRLPGNWKVSGCQASVDEGLQNSGKMRQLAGMKSRGWPHHLRGTEMSCQ